MQVRLPTLEPSQHWPRHLPLLWHQLTPLKRLLRRGAPGHEPPRPRLAPRPPDAAAGADDSYTQAHET